MKTVVVSGALLSCDQGVSPCPLVVAPDSEVDAATLTMATVDHHQPSHVAGFGMCRTQQNPAVAAATAAAQGVLTPAPCVPMLSSPWSDGAQSCELDGVALLASDAELKCAYGGAITIDDAMPEVTIG